MFCNIVGKNEMVLWNGKPNLKCFILESIFNPLLPFVIVWVLFDSMFIGLFMASIKSGEITGNFSLDNTLSKNIEIGFKRYNV